MAAEELHLDLKLEKAHYERTLRLPFPMRDRKGLLKLLLLDLETHPPATEVIAVTLRATPAPPRTLQQGLFLPAAPEPEKLEITLARIARLVGAEHVGSPEILDTHRPDAFRMVKFRLPAPSSCGRAFDSPAADLAAPVPRDRVPRIALRLFRPPLAAIVRLAGTRPVSVKARNIDGAVEALAGPWRSSGDWWTPHRWSRDEWDIALPNGVYRVYQDLDTSRWFVDGCYD
jgi:protein ImuB